MTQIVDPTPQVFETDAEIDAYNAAFDELGLNWQWDRTVMRQFAAIPFESARVEAYLTSHQPHLLSAYPAEFLASAIVEAKARRVPAALPFAR